MKYKKRVHRIEITVAADRPCTARTMAYLIYQAVAGEKQVIGVRKCDPQLIVIRHVGRQHNN